MHSQKSFSYFFFDVSVSIPNGHTIASKICSPREQKVKVTKRSLRRQVSDEVLEKRACKRRELTQIIKHSLKAISPEDKRLMF